MKYLRIIVVAVVVVVTAAALQASVIRGRIVDPESNPVAEASVIICDADSTTTMLTSDSNGAFVYRNDAEGDVDIDVQAIGFEPASVAVAAGADEVTVKLEPSAAVTELDEFVVEADKRNVVERMANGQRFFLSKKARAMNDPFMALQEIPMIISNPANSSVTTLSGNAPLILIDGKEVNSGIRPILPADIESVEVIDVVPAKYLARNVTSILNIKLRANRPPYIWTELATRHDIPICNGMGAGYFEVGNEKVSLYGRASVNYVYHSDSEGSNERENIGYRQDYDWTTRADNAIYLGELLLKYAPDASNYFAVQGQITHTPSKSVYDASGVYEESAFTLPYHARSQYGDTATIVTASAYYKHTFSPTAEITAQASYNYNRNLLDSDGTEYYGSQAVEEQSIFHSTRNSGDITIDFTKVLSGRHWLQAGSCTSIVNDRISLSPYPVFHHRNYNEYLYVSFSSQVKNIYYMLSAGADFTWLTAGEARSNYVRPRMSASATWVINPNNSLQVSYYSTNTTPSAMMLNPFNTSTDPLYVVRGNPDLKPENIHVPGLSYTFNTHGFYVTASAGAQLVSNLITAAGYTDNNGVYTSTYGNMGHFSSIFASLSPSYRLEFGELSGRVYASGSYVRSYYTGYHPKDQYSVSAGFNLSYRKFYFGCDIYSTPRSQTDIMTIKQLTPSGAMVQANYYILPNLYVSVALVGFTGAPQTATYCDNGTFKSYSYTRSIEKGWHPWILIRWNMRKHANRKIAIDRVLTSTEKGIRLK